MVEIWLFFTLPFHVLLLNISLSLLLLSMKAAHIHTYTHKSICISILMPPLKVSFIFTKRVAQRSIQPTFAVFHIHLSIQTTHRLTADRSIDQPFNMCNKWNEFRFFPDKNFNCDWFLFIKVHMHMYVCKCSYVWYVFN